MNRHPFENALDNALNEPHYKLIGKIVANCAALDLLMDSLIWRIAKVDDNLGACITAQIPNLARRIEALTSLVKLRGGSPVILKKLKKFEQNCHKLQEQRNRMVHDPWHIDTETGQIERLEVSAKHKLIFEYVPQNIDEMKNAVDRIGAQIDHFHELALEIIAEIEMQREAS